MVQSSDIKIVRIVC